MSKWNLPMGMNFKINVRNNMDKDIYDRYIQEELLAFTDDFYSIRDIKLPSYYILEDFMSQVYVDTRDEYDTKEYYQLLLDILKRFWKILPREGATDRDLFKFFSRLVTEDSEFRRLVKDTSNLMFSFKQRLPLAEFKML